MAAIQSVTQDTLEARVLHASGPVALDFYQASSPPCKVLEPRLERWAAQHKDRSPVYRVDIDRDMPVASHFAVQTIPTVLLLRDGKEIERLDGLITEEDLENAFGRALRP